MPTWFINQVCNQKRFHSVYYHVTPESAFCSMLWTLHVSLNGCLSVLRYVCSSFVCRSVIQSTARTTSLERKVCTRCDANSFNSLTWTALCFRICSRLSPIDWSIHSFVRFHLSIRSTFDLFIRMNTAMYGSSARYTRFAWQAAGLFRSLNKCAVGETMTNEPINDLTMGSIQQWRSDFRLRARKNICVGKLQVFHHELIAHTTNMEPIPQAFTAFVRMLAASTKVHVTASYCLQNMLRRCHIIFHFLREFILQDLIVYKIWLNRAS